MTIQQFQYILALDQHRHFVKASADVNITQPTLTMQVKKLEGELGFEIFDRSKKPLEPTEMGKKVIQHAKNIVQELELLKFGVQQESMAIEGEFHLGIIPTLAPYLLPLFLEKFSMAHPRLELHISELQSDTLIESISNGTIDFGIMVTPVDQRNIIEQALFYEPFWFYASNNHDLLAKHEIHPKDIENQAFWVLSQGHCFREQVLNICGRPNGIQRISYESGSIETIKRLVDEGNSFTLIPELAISKGYHKKNLRSFADPKPVREVSIVHKSTFAKKGIIHAIHDSILANLPKSIQSVERKTRIRWR